MATWPSSVAKLWIARIRHFDFYLLGSYPVQLKSFKIKVDLPKLEGQELVIRVRWMRADTDADVDHAAMRRYQEQERAEKHVRPAIEGLLSDPGMGKLGPRELEQIQLVASEAVPDRQSR
jgi:hypothetical protein